MPAAPRADAPGYPRILAILVGLAAAGAVLWAMTTLSPLIVPAFLALNLMIAVHPLGRSLTRAGVPAVVGSLVNMTAVLCSLIGFFLLIGWAVNQLVTELPQYGDQFNAHLQEVLRALARMGLSEEQINTWLVEFDFANLFGVLTGALSSVSAIGTLLAVALACIIFFGLDAIGLPARLEVVGRHRPRALVALEQFARSVRTYWVVTTLFGAVVAVIDGIALWALGVPLPAVWAMLLFLCNYIPNIGFVFAMIPPTLMALLDRGPWTALVVILFCTGAAMLLQGLVQPRVTGRAVGVSASVSFLSVLFWSWVLGAAGALLSVPMTLLVKSFLIDADPQMRWLNAFLADRPEAADEDPADREEPARSADPEAASATMPG